VRGRSQLAGLSHHHHSAQAISKPRQQPQTHGALPNCCTPKPQKRVVERRMGVLPKHRHKGAVIRLKALAHGVELIAPKAGGIDQPQGLQRKGPAHQHHSNPPASVLGLWQTEELIHRNCSKRCQRKRRSSSPRAGPGFQPPAIKSFAVTAACRWRQRPHHRSRGFQGAPSAA